ncbi:MULTISPECIES: TetR/AcrR family transcriptional regulator [unclassified Romboutsia]|uniref:TetR/AcrR family transcriptional regulator n=1 Tax=unclassified Romboutsia TaxID=2626894 RepID=UPI000820E5D6|nr:MULTISPECIES: TetR/AcrR family transcriptional regulator [unclassified Romboutsia]SCI03323.1 probable dihydroxyacetone kinase regulator [uncultured Clostridium sp.]
MYKGKNPTALQSQEMIIKGMLSIMETKSFESITIKSICEYALVSRQTFYSLFDSKEEVLELHFDKMFKLFIERFTSKNINTISDICFEFMTYIEGDKDFIELLVNNNLTYIMTVKFEQYLIKIGRILNDDNKYMHEYAMAFMAGALVEIIARYIRNGENIEPENLAFLIEKILKGEYFIIR